MHPTDAELLLALEDREEPRRSVGDAAVPPPPTLRSELGEHLARCERCGARLAELRSELERTFRRLELLDGPVPPPDLPGVLARAKEAGRWHGSRAAVAAGVVLVVVGAAAALALPRSPVRGWLLGPDREVPGAPESDRGGEGDLATAGFAFRPEGPTVLLLTGGPRRGGVTVVVTDESELRVRASDPRARFSLAPGRLEVRSEVDSLDLEVSVPPSLPGLTIRVGARVLLRLAPPGGGRPLSPGDTIRRALEG